MDPLRTGLNQISDQLCTTLGGLFDLVIEPPVYDEDLDKHVLLLNFVLDSVRRGIVSLESAAKDLERQVEARTRDLVIQKERATEANKAKDRFLSVMSHEIRTPLGAIQGFADLLAQSPELSESSRGWVEIIQKNAVELTHLLNQVLDISKIEAGQLLIETRETAVRETIQDVIRLMSLKAKEAEDQIVFHDSDLPNRKAWTDSTKFRQILVNLISNAVKFTRKGTISIHACDQGENFQVEVIDTGAGMEPEFLPRLFEPFSQAHNEASTRAGGTGLGLAVTRRLARALGGDLVLVRTELGQGSHFRVTLPWGHEDLALPRRVAPSTEPLPEVSMERRRVLLADDSPDMRLLMSRYLSDLNLTLDLVEDGQAAVEASRKTLYDLVILDVEMPRLNGYRAAQTLRAEGFGGPILAVTAYALKTEKEEALRVGCTEHLSKPIRKDLFLEEVRRLLVKSSC